MSATLAGGVARRRSSTSGTAGNHDCASSLTNIGRLNAAIPSRAWTPYSEYGTPSPVRKASTICSIGANTPTVSWGMAPA